MSGNSVDGDSYTWTIPAPGDAIGWFYAYDFIVDLESVQYVDRISVHYPRNERKSMDRSLIRFPKTTTAPSRDFTDKSGVFMTSFS